MRTESRRLFTGKRLSGIGPKTLFNVRVSNANTASKESGEKWCSPEFKLKASQRTSMFSLTWRILAINYLEEIFLEHIKDKETFNYPQTFRLHNDGHVVFYDNRTRQPLCVIEHLTPQSLAVDPNEARDRSQCEFRQEERIHEYFRVHNEDFRNSGLQRGHLAAAGNYASQELMEQTFSLANVSPQNKWFNSGVWNILEQHVR